MFHPVNMIVNENRSTLRRSKDTFTLTHAFRLQELVVKVKDGAMSGVQLGDQERYTPITKDRALELLAR